LPNDGEWYSRDAITIFRIMKSEFSARLFALFLMLWPAAAFAAATPYPPHFAFENCTFSKPGKPGEITGTQAAPILFKNVKMNGAVLHSAGQLKQTGFDLMVPARFEP
jgi:hypothetical protein